MKVVREALSARMSLHSGTLGPNSSSIVFPRIQRRSEVFLSLSASLLADVDSFLLLGFSCWSDFHENKKRRKEKKKKEKAISIKAFEI